MMHTERQDRRVCGVETRQGQKKLLDRSAIRSTLSNSWSSRLLTGFDAPILQAMYLDSHARPRLLQAMHADAAVGRPGLIVEPTWASSTTSSSSFRRSRSRRSQQPQALKQVARLDAEVPRLLPGVDRSVGGYRGLIAAQCLPDNEAGRLRGGLLGPLKTLGGPVARSFAGILRARLHLAHPGLRVRQAASGNGKLLWHALGPRRWTSSTATCTSRRSATTSTPSSWMPAAGDDPRYRRSRRQGQRSR